MVEDERSSQLFAMKVISNKAKRDRKQMDLQMRTFENDFKREASMLKNMNHPHIIKMIHANVGKEIDRQKSGESRKSNRSNNSSSGEEQDAKMESEQEFSKYIILEYAENGDLFDFIVSI